MANTCKWTIMIYMAADDAVGVPEAFRFLAELHELKWMVAEKEETRKVRILLQAYTDWDKENGEDYRARRFEIDPDFSLDNPIKVKGFNDTESMGSEGALTDFIKWSDEYCPADNYLLFLWGHGTGSSMFSLTDSYNDITKIYPDLTLTDAETGQLIKNIDELSGENSPFFREKNKIKIKITYRGSDSDGVSDNIIITKRKTDFYKDNKGETLFDIIPATNGQQNLSDEAQRIRKYLSTRSTLDALLESEIRKSLLNIGSKIDILMIMGCCMQMVEFGYEIRENCKYFVGSEELIYFHGYNYFDSFSALQDYPDMDAPTLAKRIVQEAPIKQTYEEFEKQSLAISCVDLEMNKKLADYLDKFAKLFLENTDPDKWKKIRKARKQCRHFGEDAYTYSFIDITWFFKKFSELIEKDLYYNELLDMTDSIIELLESDYVIQTWIGTKRTPSYNYARSYGGHGVGVYFPDSMEAHENNKELGKFFDKEKKGDPNKFTIEKDYWYTMIRNYRREFQKETPYPLVDSPALEDKEKKTLIEQNNDLKDVISDLLLKIDTIKTDIVGDLLLKSDKN